MLFIAEVEIRHCPPTPHCTSWAPLGSRGSAFRGGNRVLHSAGAPSRVVGSTCLDHRAGDVQMPPSRLQSTAHIYISKYHVSVGMLSAVGTGGLKAVFTGHHG